MYTRAPGIELRKRGKVDYRQLAGFGATMPSKTTDIESQNVKDTLPKSPSAVDLSSAWDPKQSMESLERELHDLELQESVMKLQADIQQRKQRLGMVGVRSDQPQSSHLADQFGAPGTSNTPHSPPLAGRSELDAALEVLRKVQLEDLLDSKGQNEHLAANAQAILGRSAKPDPILYVTDFVVFPDKSTRDREQSLGRGLFFKDKYKVKIEDVSIAQWAGATVRILLKLLPNMEKGEIADYLEFVGKMSDFMQNCEPASVLLLEEEHRVQVAREGKNWQDIDQFKAFFHLKKLDPEPGSSAHSHRSAPARQQGPRADEDKVVPICGEYNTQEGCQRAYCRFRHVCSITGCRASHPRFKHAEVPPRFRGATNA